MTLKDLNLLGLAGVSDCHSAQSNIVLVVMMSS